MMEASEDRSPMTTSSDGGYADSESDPFENECVANNSENDKVTADKNKELPQWHGERGNVGSDAYIVPESPYVASPGSKYETYDVRVDHEQGDRAIDIKIFSFRRPHMRALHCAWISFFIAFLVWFAVAPLLVDIKDTLKLTDEDIWTSSICSDATTIVMRFVVGPVCDEYAARIPMGVVLIISSIPAAMVGLVNNAAGLAALRFFIGIAGSSFVMSQFWPTRMFAKETAGTANGIVGGWGNLGGAFAQVLMGSILMPAFTNHVYDGDSEKAWRTICVIPAAIGFIWGFIVMRISDDAPFGNYSEMKKKGTMDITHMVASMKTGSQERNTWLLFIQYGCCFGVELIMNNASVLYFTREFGLSNSAAAAVGSIFGWMNVFARLIGGFFSDKVNISRGMRGRLALATICLILEGATIIAFAYSKSLGASIAVMMLFSIFTQAAEGAIYGVVPYVNRRVVGSVAGIVGAGGNAGGAVFGVIFRSMSHNYEAAFMTMGVIVLASSTLSAFIHIPGHAGLFWGKDSQFEIQERRRASLITSGRSVAVGRPHGSMNESMNRDPASTDNEAFVDDECIQEEA